MWTGSQVEVSYNTVLGMFANCSIVPNLKKTLEIFNISASKFLNSSNTY